MTKFSLTLCAALLAPPACAALPRSADLSLDAANSLAHTAIDACRKQGRAIVVSVVDRGGNLVAVQRADGVGPHNTEASRRKAYTALSTRSSTLELARNAAAEPDARNLASLPELLLLGGGLPLRAEGQVVGAIGVAGGGGALNDHACAVAAIAAYPTFERALSN
ncbi:heme-binding protein [Massilia sp. CMS3.1]|uniref:GlcG/HbpS family heme-binding protein n=1 Tax=Massilia sp. CMS3.1 TaxID=3373083 RepID=UPI003EE5C886